MKPVSWRLYAPAQKQFYNKLLLRQNLTKLEMAYNGDVGIQFMNYDVEDDISDSMKEIEERNKEPYKIDSKD